MNQELPHIYTVSALTREIKSRLETQFPLVWVSGEISNLRLPVSGHYYFTLKDADAQLRAVFFRGNHLHLRFKPQEGGQVLCRGRISVYEARGEYQIIVDYMEPLGAGALAQAFENLKARLQAEGLFDAARKQALPFLPRRLAVVTSPTGAAVRDFLRLLSRRFPDREVLIYPVKVQGAGAAPEIVRALDDLNGYPGVEVIILTRGGGSIEDLWAFNEEMVARAIYRSRIPVVSAVGHEVDFTIADFVADVRAATPSAAVELVLPDRADLERRLTRQGSRLLSRLNARVTGERRQVLLNARRLPNLKRRLADLRLKADDRAEGLGRRLRVRLNEPRQHLRLLASRLGLLSPRRLLAPARHRVDAAGQMLMQSWQRCLERRRRHLDYCGSHLEKLNPLAILARGYAVATTLPEGAIIRDAGQAPPGANIRVRLARGRLDCEVKEVAES